MTEPFPRQIEDLFCRWTTLRDARIACGELRPSRHESASFSEYVALLEQLNATKREAWNGRREEIECRPPLPRCDCGHAEALHVDGSCFAVIGCQTGCHCSKA